MKKISYFICLTATLCSCNNELPIENVKETQVSGSKYVNKKYNVK